MNRTLWVLVAALLLVAPARAATLTAIPADAPNDTARFWGAVMTEFYGPYDKSRKCWIGKFGDGRHCMRPHVMQLVSVEGITRWHLVIAGYRMGDDGGHANCHACTGSLGLVILGEGREKLELIARNTLVAQVGSWGEVPGEDAFRLRKLGPGVHGWTMTFGYTGQGYTYGSQTVFARIGSDVVEIASIPDHYDNSGTCGDDFGPCVERDYELLVDETSDGPFHDIVMRASGDWAPPENARAFRIVFDHGAMKYTVPDAYEAAVNGG